MRTDLVARRESCKRVLPAHVCVCVYTHTYIYTYIHRVRESMGKQISSLDTTASSAYKTRMQRNDWKSMYYMKDHVDMDKRGIDSPGMYACMYVSVCVTVGMHVCICVRSIQ